MALRSGSFHAGNAVGSTWCASSSRMPSHWPAKLATKVAARGSWSMRPTSEVSVASARRLFDCAAANKGASGMLLQRRYERRDASSYASTGWGIVEAGVGSISVR